MLWQDSIYIEYSSFSCGFCVFKKPLFSPLNVVVCNYVVGNVKFLRVLLCWQQGQYLARGEADGKLILWIPEMMDFFFIYLNKKH